MLGQYLPLFALFALAALFAAGSFVASVAMIFIVFDVEIVLFYPYAVARGGLGLFGLVVLLVFSFAVFESFVYLIGAGALEWGPASKSRPSAGAAEEAGSDEEIVSAARTARTTVRRVGLEGRAPSEPETVLVETASTGKVT